MKKIMFSGSIFFIALTIVTVLISGYALAGCNTPAPPPPNYNYLDSPLSLGGWGYVRGDINDISNCPWILPISVALVNTTGFDIIDHGYGGVNGVIGVFENYGPFYCTPTNSYTINFVNVTGPGNETYRVIAYYQIPGGATLISQSAPFSIEENLDTVTRDIIMFFDYWSCEHPTPTTTVSTTATTTTTTTTTGTTTMNTTAPTAITTTYTTTTTTSTMTPFPTNTLTIPTTTLSPTASTTEAPWPGLGVAVLILLVYALYMSRRG